MENGKNSCRCVSGVGCDVYNCKYNDTQCKCCTAEHIKVENKTAVKKAETFCGTFVPKTSI